MKTFESPTMGRRREPRRCANFANTIITNAAFNQATRRGVTVAQFYSTASYKNHALQGVNIAGDDLTNWNLSNQDLTGALLAGATLTGASFSNAIIARGHLSSAERAAVNAIRTEFESIRAEVYRFGTGCRPNTASACAETRHDESICKSTICGENVRNTEIFMVFRH